MVRKPNTFVLLLETAKPLLLLAGILTYSIGLGLANYLGQPLDWGNAFLGGLLILLLLLSRNYISAYYLHPQAIPLIGFSSKRAENGPLLINLQELQKKILTQSSLVALALSAAAAYGLALRKALGISEIITLCIILVVIVIGCVPPIRLDRRGYGELLETILLCTLIPAAAFLLQSSSIHQMLIFLTLPLTICYLGMRIALSFEYYSFSVKQSTGSLVSIIGWKSGMMVHNFALLLAFFTLGLFSLIRIPWLVSWPIFLALPLAVLQLIQMLRIAEGLKPNWPLLRLNAMGTFALMAYLTSVTLWLH